MFPADIQRRVAEIVENSINELHELAMTRENAIRLLLIQAACRMSQADVRRALSPPDYSSDQRND